MIVGVTLCGHPLVVESQSHPKRGVATEGHPYDLAPLDDRPNSSNYLHVLAILLSLSPKGA